MQPALCRAPMRKVQLVPLKTFQFNFSNLSKLVHSKTKFDFLVKCGLVSGQARETNEELVMHLENFGSVGGHSLGLGK